MARVESFLGLIDPIGSMTTPSNRRDWLIQHSSFLRAGSQFREKAQRYHNGILSHFSSARARSHTAFDRKKFACDSRWKAWRRYVKRRVESEGSTSAAPARETASGLREEAKCLALVQ